MVAVGSVKELFATPLSDNLLAAVMDAPKEGRNERLGIPERFGYFNAGLLLINVEKWLELNITRKCVDFIRTKSDLIVMHDQDVLNALAYDKWTKLSYKWNIFNAYFLHTPSSAEVREAMGDVRIVHFCGPVKPWIAWVAYGFIYDKYIKFTPWMRWRRSAFASMNVYKFPKNILAVSGAASLLVSLIGIFRKMNCFRRRV